jgi:hypothetical protein
MFTKVNMAAVALLFALVSTAGALPLSCAVSVPSVPLLDPNSHSAFIAEILLDCTGGIEIPNGTPMTPVNPGTEPYDGSPGRYNEFQGSPGSPNQVVFPGVPFDPPGDTGHRIFRFENIGIDATLFAPGSSVPGFFTITGSLPVPISNDPELVVATIGTPEPASLSLFGIALAAVAFGRRRFPR